MLKERHRERVAYCDSIGGDSIQQPFDIGNDFRAVHAAKAVGQGHLGGEARGGKVSTLQREMQLIYFVANGKRWLVKDPHHALKQSNNNKKKTRL